MQLILHLFDFFSKAYKSLHFVFDVEQICCIEYARISWSLIVIHSFDLQSSPQCNEAVKEQHSSSAIHHDKEDKKEADPEQIEPPATQNPEPTTAEANVSRICNMVFIYVSKILVLCIQSEC